MKIKWTHISLVGIFLIILMSSCSNIKETSQNDQTSKVVKQELEIQQGEEKLFLLHKNLNNKKQYTSDEIILFLEPFSVPTAQAFDVPKFSWMDEYARKGYDTWAMDFRGFGRSSRPKEMSDTSCPKPSGYSFE